MSIKSFALAGAAIVALSFGAGIAQADDQDDEVRALNLQQLEQAGGNASDVDATTAPSPATQQDGQGGPDLQGPPTPDEGMTDDEPADEPAADDEGDEPEADQPSPQPE
jgi:hypothetical protein